LAIMDKITIWEVNKEIISACEKALTEALKDLKLKKEIHINSEPPLISRHGLFGRLPVLEIQGRFWNLKPNCSFTKEQVIGLLKRLYLNENHFKDEGNSMTIKNNNSTITDLNYEEHLKNETGILLFYKKLCPNCKALEKMLDKFFASNPKVQHWRIDSEECPEAMEHFGVQRVPTLLVIDNGNVGAKKVGLINIREMPAFYRSGLKQ